MGPEGFIPVDAGATMSETRPDANHIKPIEGNQESQNKVTWAQRKAKIRQPPLKCKLKHPQDQHQQPQSVEPQQLQRHENQRLISWFEVRTTRIHFEAAPWLTN